MGRKEGEKKEREGENEEGKEVKRREKREKLLLSKRVSGFRAQAPLVVVTQITNSGGD